jgi:hypothetical protein
VLTCVDDNLRRKEKKICGKKISLDQLLEQPRALKIADFFSKN